MKKALLLSAYDAYSHRCWREGLLENFPGIDWTCLSLPPRYFNWRIRGNSMTWAVNEAETLKQDFDFIVATSTVDLSALIGMAPSLANIPTILYFHENQFDYPKRSQQHQSIEPQIVNLYAAVAATKIVFNSNYNRRTFLKGVADLLKKLPDHTPKKVLEILRDKSSVIPVPIEDKVFQFHTRRAQKNLRIKSELELIWNHRWEYDKGPEALLQFFRVLSPGLKLKVHIIGQSFRNTPKSFDALKSLLDERQWLGEWGFLESKSKYLELLHQSDVVLSTALHDFQGLSILEAVISGCSPLVPDRLAYAELFAGYERYSSFSHSTDINNVESLNKEALAAQTLFNKLYQQFQSQEALPSPDMSYLSWSSLSARYQALFDQLA